MFSLQEEGHEEEKCWKLHLDMLPKKFKDTRKQKTSAIVQHDLEYDFGDET